MFIHLLLYINENNLFIFNIIQKENAQYYYDKKCKAFLKKLAFLVINFLNNYIYLAIIIILVNIFS